MSVALGDAQRTALEGFIQRARRILEEDLAREAEGRFGVHTPDGSVEDEGGLHLDPAGLVARRDVVELLEFLRREEGSNSDAVVRLIREAAFTHLNRLVAIRIAEAIGLLPEVLARGPSSAGFKEVLEVAPLLAHDVSGGYWRFVQVCGDELAADIPQLFDPRNPLLALTPSAAVFDELVDLIGRSDLAGVWAAPDALGWAYQFFNSAEERDLVHKNGAPTNATELALVNQFFTPRYVVDFLVQNSLGRRLIEANPDSDLANELPLLVEAASDKRSALDLRDVRVLDPACGSGHFLLGAYDVLERAWELESVPADEAAPFIVASLWGVDIDSRCAQVASAALIFRARRHCKIANLPRPNVVTARPLPEPEGGWDAALADLTVDRRRLVIAIRDALESAAILGPLLRVEELLSSEIRSVVAGASDDSATLFGAMGLAEAAFGAAEQDVLRALREVSESAQAGPQERLLESEAQDAIRFVEAMRHRYDVVLMNPPFGSPIASTKAYLKANYPWAPSTLDLFSLFVGRGLELCIDGGYLGAITPRSGMFLSSLAEWRSRVLLGQSLVALADLGFGVMEQALVEACAYTICRTPLRSDAQAVFVRLLRETDRPTALAHAVASQRAGGRDHRVFAAPPSSFRDLPSMIVSYWSPVELLRMFSEHDSLAESSIEVRQGLATGDDFRFIRLWWEVADDKVGWGPTGDASTRWIPFAKGGEYSTVYSDVHLVLDWWNDGQHLKEAGLPGTRIQNTQFFFKPGITWPLRTASGFGARYLPGGCAFGHKGPSAFAPGSELLLLGWLTSRSAIALLMTMLAAGDETTSGTASKSYEVGLVKSLPWPAALAAYAPAIEEFVERELLVKRSLDAQDETSHLFRRPSTLDARCDGGFGDAVESVLVRNEEAVESIVAAWESRDALILDALEAPASLRDYLDQEVGPSPNAYAGGLQNEDALADLYERPMRDVVSELLARFGGSRLVATKTYVADRLLEVLAHGTQTSLRDVVRWRQENGALPNGFLQSQGRTFVSYLVGLGFGRWDLSRESLEGPDRLGFGLFPPGLCTIGNRSEASRETPASRSLLIDEAGHRLDVEAAVTSAAASLPAACGMWLAEVLAVLGRDSVRKYLRSDFFESHLNTYSRGRRRAPVYWPLTVPSGGWGVWAYAPMLSRETLYAIAAEALRREGHAEAEVARLERERSSGAGRGLKELDKALDGERKLAEELRRFRLEAERIAGLGWEPDLDDGIVLCAAPLADLFPMWKEPAQYRKELRAGKYEWSTVSKWADQL